MHPHHLHHHLRFLGFRPKKELREIYVCIFIRTLAMSMIGIFVPLYLLKELSYSLKDVVYFYIMVVAVFAIFSPLAARVSLKIGLRKSILASVPFYLGFYALLYSLKIYNWPLSLIAVVLAIASGLFWFAFNIEFAKFSDKEHRGEEVGFWYSSAVVIGLLGPLVGGLILTFYNFKILFILVSILLIGSVIPLFFYKEIHAKEINKQISLSLKTIFKKSRVRDGLSYIGDGIREYASGIFWPIFIFYLIGAYLTLGAIVSGAGVFTAIFTYFIGRSSDSFKKISMVKAGSVLDCVSWIVRIFARTALQLFGVTVFGGISFMLIDVPFSAMVYDKANKAKAGIVNYFIFREIMLSIGRILLLLLILVSFIYFADVVKSLIPAFIFTGLTTLLHMFF